MILQLIGGLVIALSLIAFTWKSFGAFTTSQPKTAVQGNILRLGTYLKPAPLNPFSTTDTISAHLLELIFNPLFHYDEQGEFRPDLAERLDISNDGRIYTVYLKKNVHFHDGTILTAEDAARTFQLMSDKRANPLLYKDFEGVQNWEVLSETIFKITLKEPSAHFLMTLARIYVIPKHSFASHNFQADMENFIRMPIGTGPFKLEDQDSLTGEIKLMVNPEYFGKEPALDGVDVAVYPDKEAVWSAFLRDEIDAVLHLDAASYQDIKGNAAFHVHRALSMGIYALIFNFNDPTFENLKIRQAVAYAINRNEIIRETAMGEGFRVSGPFHPASWAHNPDVPEQVYDPLKAKKILKESGLMKKDGDPLFLELLVNSKDAHMLDIAKVMRQQLQEIGVRVRFHFFSSYQELAKKAYEEHSGFQCYLLMMNTGMDPDVVRQYWHTGAAINISHYENSQVDALFDEAMKERRRDVRQQAYRKIHAKLVEDQAAVFLYAPYVFHAVSSRFEDADFLSSPFFQIYMLKDLALQPQPATVKGGDADDGNY